jgi:Cd2+/Zn2+-exporting ATPase
MCCADEVTLLEKELARLDGVAEVRCNLVASTVTVDHDPGRVPVDDLIAAVRRTGMKAAMPGGDPDGGARERRWHLVATVVAGAFVGVGLLLHWLGAGEPLEVAAFAAAMVAGGWFIAPKAVGAARRLSPDMNLLMGIASVGAAFIGAWDEAASVVFLFSLAELIEAFSLSRARRAIGSLMELAPPTALVKHGDHVHERSASEVGVGETILVKPGARVPLDGVVTSGESGVNQAPITGESMPVDKVPGSEVFAGSINGRGSLEVRVTRPASDSTVARIIHLVEEAQSRKAPAQRFVDVFARVYTPIVMAIAVVIAVAPPLLSGASWGIWIYRALVMLVIACPCALVISTPVSIVSGLTAAARRGVLIKGGAYLEALGRLRVLAVDKTGTLTEGRPRVMEVVGLNAARPGEILRVAAALEAHSEHPMAEAIVAEARRQGVAVPAVEKFRSLTGRGVEGLVDGHDYFAGNHRLVEELAVCSAETERRIEAIERRAETAVVVGHRPHADCKGEVLGVIALGDAIRPHAGSAIARLRRAGVERIVMLTGDNRATAETVAKEVGITEVAAELLPDEKIARVREMLRDGANVGMVGDGVNDAPALAAASVGIGMGVAGTDAALEAADVALMGDDLTHLPETIELGRRTRRVIQSNIALAIALKVVFLALAAAGLATMWMAVAADMGASLLVIANGLRLLRAPAAAGSETSP